MENMELLADRIRSARKSKNWTQAYLAQKAKLSVATISAYENSDAGKKANPSLENIIKIAQVLEVSIDWLCGLTNHDAAFNQNTEISNEQILFATAVLVDNAEFSQQEDYHGAECDILEIMPYWNLTKFVKEYTELSKVKNILPKEMFDEVVANLVKKYAQGKELFEEIITDDDLPF